MRCDGPLGSPKLACTGRARTPWEDSRDEARDDARSEEESEV